MSIKLRQRERDSIIQSLRSGVTPRTGLQYIQVGRVKEIASIIKDINRVADEGSTFRLVIGDFGAGKSFFLQLVKAIALEKGLITMHADLAPDRATCTDRIFRRYCGRRWKPTGRSAGSGMSAKHLQNALRRGEWHH